MRDIFLADRARIKDWQREIVPSGSYVPLSHCILATGIMLLLKAIGELLQAALSIDDVLFALPLPSRIAAMVFGVCHMGVAINA